MKQLIKKVLRSAGYEVLRYRPEPPVDLVAEVCRRCNLPRVTPVELETYRKACPPLLPKPTVVPRASPLFHYSNLADAVDNQSIRAYFEVSRQGDDFLLTDDFSQSHYYSRQRMLYTAYNSYLGPRLDGLSTLDIGCSSGFYTFYTSRLGAKDAMGIDARPEHEGQFKMLHAMMKMPTSCHYRPLDMEFELEKLQRTFDVVLAQGVMYHVYDHPRFVRNLYRMTDKLVIIEGSASGRMDKHCLAVMEKKEEMRASIHGPALSPSIPWIVELMRWAGFKDLAYIDLPAGIDDVWHFKGLYRVMIAGRK
jgi:2-polyprenyl-3-methyl-5-hydroxy-6-metoxy-1,4-benzoquinol methylase